MPVEREFWSQDRPPDDPYAYRVVTVGHGSVAAPAVKELVEQLHAGVDAVLVAVGGVASRTVDDERGESSWLLAPPRAGDLADMVIAVTERLNPGAWTVERF
jgi:glycosyltransferase involved in cell wall biosynthesis